MKNAMEPESLRNHCVDYTAKQIGIAIDIHRMNIESLMEEDGASLWVMNEVRRSLIQVKSLALLGATLDRSAA